MKQGLSTLPLCLLALGPLLLSACATTGTALSAEKSTTTEAKAPNDKKKGADSSNKEPECD